MFLIVTVTLNYSVALIVSHSLMYSAPYGNCHCAPYRRSAVVMNVPGPHTASRQTMQQPVTPAISTLCCTQDPPVNVDCH